MKKIIILALAAAVFAISCERIDHAEGQKVTYYPILTLTGGDVVMNTGGNFVDPGYTATLNGEDVSSQVVTENNINNQVPGAYTVTYTIVNEDGFSSSTSRGVYVVAPNSFANFYYSEVQNKSGSRHYYNAPITITKSGENYVISDLMGGLYFHGIYPSYAAAGYDFWAEGLIKLNDDNTITLLKEGDWYFYDPDDPITIQVGVYDPETASVHLEVGFSGSTSYYIDLVTPSAN